MYYFILLRGLVLVKVLESAFLLFELSSCDGTCISEPKLSICLAYMFMVQVLKRRSIHICTALHSCYYMPDYLKACLTTYIDMHVQSDCGF